MTIETLSEYVSYVTALRDEWFPNEQTWTPWFRGQTNADWALIPGVYRHWQRAERLFYGDRNLEDELRQEFLVRAPSFTAVRPQSPWGWYFLMQHSLAPTRLLDWTEGALIALYFAVRDNKGETDAAVWALDPWWLNGRVLGRSEVFSPETMSAHDLVRYEPWLPELFADPSALPPDPIAVYPAHTAQRISTQRSCFTVHGWKVSPFEEFLKDKHALLRKVLISATKTSTIKRELLTCGVDEVTIYPDLDGLGRYLGSVPSLEIAGGENS